MLDHLLGLDGTVGSDDLVVVLKDHVEVTLALAGAERRSSSHGGFVLFHKGHKAVGLASVSRLGADLVLGAAESTISTADTSSEGTQFETFSLLTASAAGRTLNLGGLHELLY